MTEAEPVRHYKNLQEMIESPEYREFVRLVRQGCKEGIFKSYPPLPKEGEVK